MIKRILIATLILLSVHVCYAQSRGAVRKKIQPKPVIGNKLPNTKILNGQWRGFFGSNGDIVTTASDNTEYVLELDINGTKISGYSYSYFQNRMYYVICSLEGEYDKITKTIVVNEIAPIKRVMPPGSEDCLQTHTLIYKKEGATEVLTGTWKASPNQIGGNCGFGNTTLIRRTLSNSLASYNKSTNSTPFSAPKRITKTSTLVEHTKPKPPIVKTTPQPEIPVTEPVLPPANPIVKTAPVTVPAAPEKQVDIPVPADINYEKRTNTLLQTITIENPTIRVDLYDNGIVDGDSISLFYNSKLILFHQRLSETAITLTLNVNTNRAVNDLTMYAENLGEIPPNTALMVVTDGDKRYEVPVTSDLKNSGSVRFIFSGEK